MTDSKYFTTTKKGEIFELKSELNSDKKEKKKEAVKKVIASMTVGECCWQVCGFDSFSDFHLFIFLFIIRDSNPLILWHNEFQSVFFSMSIFSLPHSPK